MTSTTPSRRLRAMRSASLATLYAYAAGTSFVESDGDTGRARNESSTTPAVLYVTYIVPVGTAVLRIDQPDPGC